MIQIQNYLNHFNVFGANDQTITSSKWKCLKQAIQCNKGHCKNWDIIKQRNICVCVYV